MGFVLNPYNQYITNCIIEGKQCIIAWYVVDTRISHKDPNIVTRIIQKLEQRFDKMTVTRGQEYVFLGIHIRYTNKGTAVITMKDYLTEAIEESGLDISKSVSTPASRHCSMLTNPQSRSERKRVKCFTVSLPNYCMCHFVPESTYFCRSCSSSHGYQMHRGGPGEAQAGPGVHPWVFGP
jgi:hypothetical protein